MEVIIGELGRATDPRRPIQLASKVELQPTEAGHCVYHP